jgi:hypothetical protein
MHGYNYHHRNVDRHNVNGDEQPPYDFQATAVENLTSVLSVLALIAAIKISIVSLLYIPFSFCEHNKYV